MGKTSSGAIDRYSSTLKILKTKRPYDLLFQDEDEGVEQDAGGTSVCSQSRDDSWFVLIFASFQSSVIKEAVDKNARALIELFTRREPRSDSFATSSPHGPQFGQKLNPPFFKFAEICWKKVKNIQSYWGTKSFAGS